MSCECYVAFNGYGARFRTSVFVQHYVFRYIFVVTAFTPHTTTAKAVYLPIMLVCDIAVVITLLVHFIYNLKFKLCLKQTTLTYGKFRQLIFKMS